MIALETMQGSSQIAATGYDPVTHVLAVRFHSGDAVFHYKNVPPDKAASLRKAESPGKYLHSAIKGRYEYERVSD